MEALLSRDEFRQQCLERDGHKCVICGHRNNLAVHHIIERRLFDNGGYYKSNGATLCPEHHILAEETTLSCDQIREACGITGIILPEHAYSDMEYDKWLNPILSTGRRLPGELFWDESVRKILTQGNVLQLFDQHFKYPRTMHLDFSNPSKDDKILHDYSKLENEDIVVTIKLDGENTNMYRDYIHARSLEPLCGQDRGWVKALHAQIRMDIPEGWRICGENVYAMHSIHYTKLESYFYVFSIWNEKNICLSWGETMEWCFLLGLSYVPVLYQGKFDYNLLKQLSQNMDYSSNEGFVVRPSRAFAYREFRHVVCKMVRPDHIQSDHHWRNKPIVMNLLRNSQQNSDA